MSTQPDDDDDLEVGDEANAASLTDLKVSQEKSGLSAQAAKKAGDITEQLARIKLPGEADLSAVPEASEPSAPAERPPLRAVRELDTPSPAPPAPAEQVRPTEQLKAATEQVAASRDAADMGHAETQQELLSMMDRISAGFSGELDDGGAAAPPPPASAPEPPPLTATPPPEPPQPAPEAPPEAPQEPAPAPAQPAASTPPPPAPETAPAEPAEPEAPKAEPFSRMPQGLMEYWMSLTKGRKYPSWSDFDSSMIAEYWPNSMVLTCGGDDGRGDVSISKVTRIADQNVTPSTSGANRVEYTPMLTEWILSLGKAAAGTGKPMHEFDRFPTNEGLVRYQIILLPLSDSQSSIDHVLCHVYRA